MNKRGQGLPLNVIVIAIIVVVALVVIVAFFLGGFGQLGGKAGETAGVGLKGTSQALAVACVLRQKHFHHHKEQTQPSVEKQRMLIKTMMERLKEAMKKI
ncbi:hypothetical protein J4414_04055 [Candidatus Woesearchaeota archaeon]|nr:hypothetical protein [Candidatus Woesearchaeota archaeon]